MSGRCGKTTALAAAGECEGAAARLAWDRMPRPEGGERSEDFSGPKGTEK